MGQLNLSQCLFCPAVPSLSYFIVGVCKYVCYYMNGRVNWHEIFVITDYESLYRRLFQNLDNGFQSQYLR